MLLLSPCQVILSKSFWAAVWGRRAAKAELGRGQGDGFGEDCSAVEREALASTLGEVSCFLRFYKEGCNPKT